MSNAVSGIIAVLTAIVGVAIVAVIVSDSANTAGVLTAGGNAFATSLKAAVSPVTSGSGLGSINAPNDSLYQ
jgi:membrane DNA delivery protein